MHLMFEIPELVRNICQHISRDKDLLHLGCCASVFLEPALDVLWREQYGFDNILRCFPHTVWSERDGWPSKALTLNRPFKASDWARFTYYARRVRNLDMQTSSLADDEVYDSVLASVAKPRYLFPRLTSLTLSDSPHGPSWLFLDLLLPPSLTHLTLFLDEDRSMPILSFLHQIHLRCPDVSYLSVFAPEYKNADQLGEALANAVTSYRSLQIVAVPYLSGRALKHLCEIETLTKLILRSGRLAPVSVFDLDKTGFPALEVLDVDDRPSQCAKLLRSISSRHLYNVRLYLSGLCTRSSWAEVISAIAAFKSRRTSLKDLYIEELIDKGEDEPATILNIEDLRPLLSLRALTDFCIGPHKPLDLTNDDIEQIAKSWPELSDLSLGNSINYMIDEPPCRVTMEALAHLVEHCPNLSKLSIDFIATGDKLPTYKPGNGYYNEEITSLDCTNTVISAEDIPVAASYFSSLFPSLNHLYYGGIHNERRKVWRQVQDLLLYMSNIRNQERIYWCPDDSSEEEVEGEGDKENGH